ncbi:MAG: hypothetical protein HXM97_01065 [Parvimonas sp.]|nr:hypothetical protein [Parvimonas sp.]
MKKILKKCFIFALVTLFFCSCSAKGVKIEQLIDKSFISKEKAFTIEETKDGENSSDSKKYHLVMYEQINSGAGYMIYENAKITKKNGKEFITADNLDLDLEIINDKTIKDTKNNVEYKESKQGEFPDNLDSINKIKITEDIKNISNKSFISDSGVQIVFAVTENGQANLFIKENGKETHYSNANLKQENGKTYITANGLKNKFVYSSISKIIDEDTKVEYKLNTKK